MSEIHQFSYHVGHIIQITDENHPWFPCLLIVTEVKSWGVVAYVIIPQTNDGSIKPTKAFNRLEWGVFDHVGTAAYVRQSEEIS